MNGEAKECRKLDRASRIAIWVVVPRELKPLAAVANDRKRDPMLVELGRGRIKVSDEPSSF